MLSYPPMMSLLRIALGVLVGIGILVGAAFLAKQFPVAAGRVWFMTLGLGVGTLLLSVVRSSLRSGVCGGRRTSYHRSASPIHFWFYIVFYSFLGAIFVAFGVSSVVAPHLLSLR